MKKFLISWLFCAAGLIVSLASISSFATGGTQYVITNDDLVPELVSVVSVYSVAPDGSLGFPQFVATFGNGINGGFFGLNRLRVLNSGNQQCVFASEAFSGEIAGVDLNNLNDGSLASGSLNDAGSSNGVGLAGNSQYLYASLTDSHTHRAFSP